MTTRLAAVQRAALLAIAGPSVTCVMRSSARARSARRIRRRLRARCRRRTNRSACASCASRRRLLPRSAQPLRSASHVAWFVAAVADCARQVASEASRAAVAMGCRLQPHAAPRCATRVVPRRRCDVSCLLQPLARCCTRLFCVALCCNRLYCAALCCNPVLGCAAGCVRGAAVDDDLGPAPSRRQKSRAGMPPAVAAACSASTLQLCCDRARCTCRACCNRARCTCRACCNRVRCTCRAWCNRVRCTCRARRCRSPSRTLGRRLWRRRVRCRERARANSRTQRAPIPPLTERAWPPLVRTGAASCHRSLPMEPS